MVGRLYLKRDSSSIKLSLSNLYTKQCRKVKPQSKFSFALTIILFAHRGEYNKPMPKSDEIKKIFDRFNSYFS